MKNRINELEKKLAMHENEKNPSSTKIEEIARSIQSKYKKISIIYPF